MKEPDLVTDALGRRVNWTAQELDGDEFPEPQFAVPGLLAPGFTFLGGAPKLGKSMMAFGLNIAVASGGRALGCIPVEAAEALYLDLEDSPRRAQQRMRTVLNGEPAPAGLDIWTAWPRWDEGGFEQLEEYFDDHAALRLAMVDVWARVKQRAGNRSDPYQSDYDNAAKLQALAISKGVSVVALTHTRKAEADDWVATLQGTFGSAAAADTLIIVRRARGQADATLAITGRDVEEQELALRFSGVAGTWTLLGDAADWALGETRLTIREVVKLHGDLSPKQVSELTGIERATARVTMSRMANDGQLVASRGRYSIA